MGHYRSALLVHSNCSVRHDWTWSSDQGGSHLTGLLCHSGQTVTCANVYIGQLDSGQRGPSGKLQAGNS